MKMMLVLHDKSIAINTSTTLSNEAEISFKFSIGARNFFVSSFP